jgi:hypothetical protein
MCSEIKHVYSAWVTDVASHFLWWLNEQMSVFICMYFNFVGLGDLFLAARTQRAGRGLLCVQ